MFGFNRVYRSHVTVYVVLTSPAVSYVFAISDVLVVSDIAVAVFKAFPNLTLTWKFQVRHYLANRNFNILLIQWCAVIPP
jgi:hypothetical protein